MNRTCRKLFNYYDASKQKKKKRKGEKKKTLKVATIGSDRTRASKRFISLWKQTKHSPRALKASRSSAVQFSRCTAGSVAFLGDPNFAKAMCQRSAVKNSEIKENALKFRTNFGNLTR